MKQTAEKKIINLKEYKEQFNTVFTGDFKRLFAEEAKKLVGLMLPVYDRMEAIEFLTERFFEDVGRMPTDITVSDSSNKKINALDYLSSHILYESLEGDTRADKITLEEFPVVTESQTKRRRRERGEISVDVSKACVSIGSDGRNYREPTRRVRKPYEHDKVEKQAADKMRETDAQYKAATSPSKITRKKAA
ncbi:hypothetical protein ACE41F_26805 [Bacillus cereus]|uniref:hypothetical protein n=1 Tax=Bacillus cereus TaxID=1396 RepID=UPI0035CADFF0